jgi:hypothetical protein
MANIANLLDVLVIQNANILKNKSIKKGQGHVVPINTRIINHHVYKHTYNPCFTCTEENEVCNVTEPNCCNKFM